MNKEEMEKIINDIKDSLWCLENKKCNIDTKEKSWETYYGLNDELIKYIRKIEQENKQLKVNCNIGNENLKFYQYKNKQLKENRNKLKENIKRRKEKFDSGIWCELDTMGMFDYLLHNLESGDGNE